MVPLVPPPRPLNTRFVPVTSEAWNVSAPATDPAEKQLQCNTIALVTSQCERDGDSTFRLQETRKRGHAGLSKCLRQLWKTRLNTSY